MLWAVPLVLAGVTANLSVVPASTYDQAACDEESEVRVAQAEEPGHCAPADPVVVIDCDDPGMTPWVAEMIGSCEMVRPTAPGLKPDAIKPARGAVIARGCSGIGCGHDSTPLRSGASGPDDQQAICSRITLAFVASTSHTPESVLEQPRPPAPQRLERPPRA